MTTIHPDEAAFLAAIRADPADDTVRLVYADWLEEHGQSARAEFIRVQIRLSSPPDGMHFWRGQLDQPKDVRQYIADEQRNLYLFGLHGAEWFGPRACLTPPCVREERAGGEWLIVRRGFVSEVRLPLAAFCGGPCERCGGDGRAHGADRPFEWSADVDYGKCVVCRGTGRIHGLAAELVLAHPLTAVRLIDQTPADFAIHGFRYSYLPTQLPFVLYESLMDEPGDGMLRWRTVEEAEDALSRACVRLARRWAGLPELKE